MRRFLTGIQNEKVLLYACRPIDKGGMAMKKNIINLRKVFILLATVIMLAPIFFMTAVKVSYAQETTVKSEETKDNLSNTTLETTQKTEQPPKQTESTTSSDMAEKETTEVSEETTKTTEETATKSSDTSKTKTSAELAPDVLEKLKAYLPTAEIRYQDGTLTIQLASGEQSDYAKSLIQQLAIQVPVEITAKLATTGNQSDAYKAGYQFFNDDMTAQADKNILGIFTGNLPLVAKLMDRAKINSVTDVQDIIDGMKNAYSRVQHPSILGSDQVYLEKSTQKYVFYFVGINLNSNYQSVGNIWNDDFRNGYLAAMVDFKTEMNKFLQHITTQAQIDQDSVANNATYRPPSTDSSGFGGNIANLIKALEELWTNYNEAPLDKNGTQVFVYTPTPGINAGTQDTVSKTVRSLLVMIGLIIPTVQNKLIKQVLEDPRAIGGEAGVFLGDNDTLAGAMVIGGKSLSDILGYMGFADAINSTVANTIYLGIRDAIKSALVNALLEGEKENIKNLISGTKFTNKGWQLDQPRVKGETLALAKDVGFSLTNTYVKELRNIAIQSAIKKQKMSNTDLFTYLNTNVAAFKTEAAGKNRIMSDGGKAARELLYVIYEGEYEAITKAITDYKARPAEDPEALAASQKFYLTLPFSDEKIEVIDYQIIRKWLFEAGLARVKEGIVAADLKSHQQLDANVTKLDQTPADKLLTVADKQVFDQNTLYDWSEAQKFTNNALTPLRPTLVEIVKDAYQYGYNSETVKVNKSFEAGEVSFQKQSQAMATEEYLTNGPLAIDLNNDFDVDGFKYSQKSDQSGRIIKGQNQDEFLQGTIDGKVVPLSGVSYVDGVRKAAKEQTVTIKFQVTGVAGQEDEFQTEADAGKIIDKSEVGGKYVATLVPFTRFVTLAQNKISVAYPQIDGWEVALKAADKQFETALNDQTVIKNPTGEFDPYDKVGGNSVGYKLQNILKEQPTVAYSKLITPVINTLNLTGNDDKGYVVSGQVTTHERTVINFKRTSTGDAIAQVTPDASGQFSMQLTKDQVETVGDKKQILAIATFENEYGTLTKSAEKQAELATKIAVQMGFNPELTDKKINQSTTTLGFLSKIDFYHKVDSQGESHPLTFYVRNLQTGVQNRFDAKEGLTQLMLPLIVDGKPFVTEGDNTLVIEAFAEIDKQNVLVSDEPLIIQVTYVNESLTFDVTTTDDANTLKWTKRVIALPGTIFKRDAGNKLKIKVADKRLPEKQNKWALYATANPINNLELTFNGQKLSSASTLILTGTDSQNEQEIEKNTIITKKTFAEDEGILLTSEKGIAIGNYASKNDTAPTVNWALVNTFTAE